MTDETTTPAAKSPEEKKIGQAKRKLRKIRLSLQMVREKAKGLTAERKQLQETYNAVAAEAGLPAFVAKGKSKGKGKGKGEAAD
jgi:hypothetical protein